MMFITSRAFSFHGVPRRLTLAHDGALRYFGASRRVGALLCNSAAASLATAVPSKKRGF
jgi:hypothetical protein